VALALAVLVVRLVGWLRPAPATVFVLVEADYATNLSVPLNPYAAAVRRNLTERADAEPRTRVVDFVNCTFDRREPLLAELETGNPGETRVVFVALHGIAEAGKAFLLTADAGTGGRTAGRILLTDVLAALGRSRAGHKLLILDATGPSAAPNLGAFRNDFAEVLNGLEAEIRAVPNLVVISASGPGERSWPAQEYRRTAFTHFILEALAGAADADGNGRVTAREAFEFAERETRAYAERHFAARQNPVLLPAGDGPVRAAAMHLVRARVPYHPLAPCTFGRPTFSELKGEWQWIRKLAGANPPPQAYAPETWIEYLATLRRAEQLNLRGSYQAAGALTDRLSRLRGELDERREILLVSGSLSSSGTAVGRPLGPADPADRALLLVRDRARPVDAPLFAELARAQLAKPSGSQDWLRLAKMAILDRAAADVRAAPGDIAAALRPAAEYARVLNDQAHRTVPAPELNLLAVFARDLAPGDGPEWRELVARVLLLRRTAEEAAVAVRTDRHSYSELVVPWVADHVARGDNSRRRVEDRLFGEPGADAAATQAYDQSRSAYDEALADAQTVRRAIEERDHSAADLHEYARWAALVPPSGPRDQGAPGVNSLALVENLSTAVTDLSKALRVPDPARTREQLKELDDLRAAVATRREELEKQYGRALKAAAGLPAPGFWSAAECIFAAAPVPRDAARRDEQAAAREELWEAWTNRVWGMRHDNPATATGPDADAPARHARAAGAVAQLALAGSDGPAHTELQRLLGDLAAGRADAGPQFGTFQDRLPERIVRLCREGFTADTREERDDEGRTARFAAATALSRALDGTTNDRLFYRERESARYVTVRPGDANRRWLIRRLLDRQAERAIEDNWFDGATDPHPYFRDAATAYLDERLPLNPDLGADERHSARGHHLLELLGERSEFDVRPAAVRPVVGAPGDPVAVRPAVRYRSPALPERVPERSLGALAYWLEVPADPLGHGRSLVSRRLLGPLTSAPSAFASSAVLPPVTLPVADTGPAAADAARVVLRARYRGRVLDRANDLTLSPVPDSVVEYVQPPPTGRVAVRSGPDVGARFGEPPGAVAVVLDCSGSMGARAGENQSKYAVAIDALKEVLGGLPEGTGLSVWVFGADVPGERPTAVEDTVRRVRPLAPWAGRDLPALETALRQLRPMYESPITFATLRARAELAAGPGGFASVVLLTDGLDNRWEKDARNNPMARPVAEALRGAFDRSDVRLDVIAFSVPTEEDAGVQAQFRVTERLNPPGRFVNVAEVTKLVAPLREAVLTNRRIRGVLRAAADPAVEYPVVAGAAGGDGWSPALAPGAYQFRTGTPSVRLGDLAVGPGDNLVLRLSADKSGQLRLNREVVTDRDFGSFPPGVRRAATRDWQLVVAENRVEAGTLRLVPLLERLGEPDRLEVVRPGRVWFEVRGGPNPSGFAEGTSPAPGRVPTVRWKSDYGYPVAAWRVEAAEWLSPGGHARRPQLTAWWDDGTEGPVVTAAVGAATPVKGGAVTVTRSEVRPDPRGGVLEVVVTCPSGQAFWVRPTAAGWVPVSHQFYRGPGRVVATFRAERGAPGRPPDEFELVSVEQFKVLAARAGRTLDLPGLDEPTVQFPAPHGTGGGRPAGGKQ
jgi:hypothetical protein